MQNDKSFYKKINVLEARISFISNRYVNMQKGFEFKTKENKFGVDLILQQFRETILLCELEFANNEKPFLIIKDGKVIPTYGNVHIPPRRNTFFNNNPRSFYLRILGNTFQEVNQKSLTYTNLGKNITNLPRDPCYNKYSLDAKERFFSDDFSTNYYGFCGSYLECLKWISQTSNIVFLRKEGVNKRKDVLKIFQTKLFDFVKENTFQEV